MTARRTDADTVELEELEPVEAPRNPSPPLQGGAKLGFWGAVVAFLVYYLQSRVPQDLHGELTVLASGFVLGLAGFAGKKLRDNGHELGTLFPALVLGVLLFAAAPTATAQTGGPIATLDTAAWSDDHLHQVLESHCGEREGFEKDRLCRAGKLQLFEIEDKEGGPFRCVCLSE